jgi:hypothetical protein
MGGLGGRGVLRKFVLVKSEKCRSWKNKVQEKKSQYPK